MVDSSGVCIAVSVFNLADGKGVIIGDSVAIPEPYVTDVDFTYEENVRFCSNTLHLCCYTFGLFQKYKFRLIRVETPLVMVLNGKKANRNLQAGVHMSIFKKFD